MRALELCSRRQELHAEFPEAQDAHSSDERWGVLRKAAQSLISLPSPIEDRVLQQAKRALNAHGGWLSSYIDGALLCIGPEAAAQAVRKTPGVEWLVRGTSLCYFCSVCILCAAIDVVDGSCELMC